MEAQELAQLYNETKSKDGFIAEVKKKGKKDIKYYEFIWEVIDATYDLFVL